LARVAASIDVCAYAVLSAAASKASTIRDRFKGMFGLFGLANTVKRLSNGGASICSCGGEAQAAIKLA
jgi:hypothetical protein